MFTAAFVCLLWLTHPSDTDVGVDFLKTQQPQKRLWIQGMETLRHRWWGWFRSSSADLFHTLLLNESLHRLQPLGQKMEVRADRMGGGFTAGNLTVSILDTCPALLCCSSLIPVDSGGRLKSPPRCCSHVCAWQTCSHSCDLIFASTASFVPQLWNLYLLHLVLKVAPSPRSTPRIPPLILDQGTIHLPRNYVKWHVTLVGQLCN